jgi:hypothetical protein
MAEKRKVTYFSPSSFYVYSMASWINNVPSYYYGYKDSAAAPLLGLGYTVVNFGDRMLLNLELDASTAEFDFAQIEPTRIWFYTFLFNGEYRLFPVTPLSFYLGFGGTVFDYDSAEGSEFVLTFNVGAKVRLAKHLMLRVELRHHWQGTGDYYYWDDEWGYYGDEVSGDPFGTAIAAGVEFHF